MKDPYETLGVPWGTEFEDVRKAYRKLAAKFHPDVEGGSTDKFREITAAFQTIKNTPAAPNDEVPEFVDELSCTLEMTLEEIAFGCQKTVSAKISSVKCKACLGAGSLPGTPMMPCVSCLGTGRVTSVWGFNNSTRPCQTCKGSGTIPAQACKLCSGRGKMSGEAKVNVSIPSGVANGQELIFRGNLGNNLHGKLFVKIVEMPHRRFDRCGDDLSTSLKMNVFDAMRGRTMPVTRLDGSDISISIPPGTQPGEIVIAQGEGIHNAQTGRTGDLRVTVQVEVPRKMSLRAARLVEELADEFIRK